MISVQLFISLAATYNWDLHQFDITNVFLHDDLQEEVYMEQPSEFVAQGEIGKCLSSSEVFLWFETESPCVVW